MTYETSSIWWLMWKPKGKPAFLAGLYLWLAGPASRWRSTSSRLSTSQHSRYFDKPVSFQQLFHPLWITVVHSPTPCTRYLELRSIWTYRKDWLYYAQYKNKDNQNLLNHFTFILERYFEAMHFLLDLTRRIVPKQLISTLEVLKVISFLLTWNSQIFICNNSNFPTISKAIL